MEKMRFEGKVVIVTGASSGIGRSTARLFAMEGAKVVAAARRMKRLEDLLTFVLPLYAEEGKSALVIAIGCTGGHHRSVAVAHELAEYITEEGYQVTENHRDISR